MATYAKLLQDSNGDVILPYTRDSLIFNDDNTTLQYRLNSGTVHNATLWNGMSIANQASGGQQYYWGFNGGASTTYPIPISTIAEQTLTYSGGMVLIWINQSPSSGFGEQTITIAANTYGAIVVFVVPDPGDWSGVCYLVINATRVRMQSINYGGYQGSRTVIYTKSTGAVTFSVGGNSTGGADNSKAIPVYIFGVKGYSNF